ncbi:MAG: O-antigen ligase family protein [Anaerolineae bacterium]
MMSSQRVSPLLLLLTLTVLVFGLTAIVSMKASYDAALSLSTLIAVVVSVAVYVIVSYMGGGMQLVSVGAAITGVLFAFFFISQFAHRQYVETPQFITRLGTLTTFLPNLFIYIHQNSAATILEMLLPMLMAALVWTRSGRVRLLWGVGALLMLYALLLTYSRGAWAALAVTAVIAAVVFSLRHLSRERALLTLVASIILIAILVAVVLTLGRSLPGVQGALDTLNSRLDLYRNSLYLVSDYPFTGIGLGDTFAMVYSRFSLLIFVPFLTYAHNLPLAIWLGQGIVGFIAFIAIVLIYYRYVVRVLVWSDPEPIFHGAWLGVTATLLHGLVDSRQYVESPVAMPLLFFGMGLTVACGRQALWEAGYELYERRRRRMLLIATLLVVVLIAAGAAIYRKTLVAAWYTNFGAIDETQSDNFIAPSLLPATRSQLTASARMWYEKALEINPDYPNANRRLGNMLVNTGEYAAALPYLEKAYAAEPGGQAAIKGLGLDYTWLGRTTDAACTFQHLTDLNNMAEELYNWQNYQYEQQKPLLSAYALEAAAILGNYEQTNMDVWILIGDRFREAGRPQQALVWYKRVLAKEPQNTVAITKLGEIADVAQDDNQPITFEVNCPA